MGSPARIILRFFLTPTGFSRAQTNSVLGQLHGAAGEKHSTKRPAAREELTRRSMRFVEEKLHLGATKCVVLKKLLVRTCCARYHSRDEHKLVEHMIDLRAAGSACLDGFHAYR